MSSRINLSREIVCRLLLLLLLPLIFAPFGSGDAWGKGGTNMHEGLPASHAGMHTYESILPSQSPRGRYRDPHTHKCRGPADIRN